MPCLADQVADIKRELDDELTQLVQKYEAKTGFHVKHIEVKASGNGVIPLE